MREIEIRRHSLTKKGSVQVRGCQLSAEGVRLAREIGFGMGPFDLVLTSEVSRTSETALAMGFAVDGHVCVPSAIRSSAIAVIGHHQRWSWTEPWERFSTLVREGGSVTAFGSWFRAAWSEALNSVDDGGRVLVVSHGRDIEAGVVACLDAFQPEDFTTWGEPLHHCEGVRMAYADGGFVHPEVLRTCRCEDILR